MALHNIFCMHILYIKNSRKQKFTVLLLGKEKSHYTLLIFKVNDLRYFRNFDRKLKIDCNHMPVLSHFTYAPIEQWPSE